jgi:type II secretory pathway pseudopilin PulG
MSPDDSKNSANALCRARRARCCKAAYSGFTLVEALVSISIAAIASSALFLGVSSSIQTTEFALQETMARGMAEQVIDEVLGNVYAAAGAGPYQTALGPNSTEASGVGRTLFNDTDDFANYTGWPPEDPYGIELGQDDGEGATRHANFQSRADYFDNWVQYIQVYYVDESNPSVQLSAGQTSNLRAVDVTIYYYNGTSYRTMANVRRVFGYIPAP